MYSVLLANARWERTFGTPCSGQYNRLELVRINEVRARTTFRMSQATNSSLICFVLYKKHVWTSFFASRNFPKTSRLYWSADFFLFFHVFFVMIFLLTSWHFSPKILITSLEHSLHGRGCLRFAVGVRNLGVGAREAPWVFWHPQLNTILHLCFYVR